MNDQGEPRQLVRSNLRWKLEEVQERLSVICREIDGLLYGLEHDPMDEGRFVEQNIYDETTQGMRTLDASMNSWEQAITQISHVVWNDLY